MAINIGNRNNINHSIIAENSVIGEAKQHGSFASKHPIIISIIIALITGLILMFSFWRQIIEIIEKSVGELYG